MGDGELSDPQTFKESFKFYKSRWPDPDLSKVLDADVLLQQKCTLKKLHLDLKDPLPLGLKPPAQWNCFEIENRPGLVFVRNPFTALGQRYWMVRSVRDYPKAPNVVNLLPQKFEQAVIDDWWRAFRASDDLKFRLNLRTAMRWATLGYHHDWDTKVYSETMRNRFPEDLAEMTGYFAKVLDYPNYSAQAAIVNFYPIGTTLSGHTDHSEVDLDAPLFSFSFGQQAIFLIGGQTREEPATALYLKSGDVVVMSRESRLCYHAVPRVMKDCSEPWNNLADLGSNQNDEVNSPDNKRQKLSSTTDSLSAIQKSLFDESRDDLFWKPFSTYLQDTRININIRQVLKEGQTSL